MRRRSWRRRAAGWALSLLAVGAAGWVGLERLRPPLLIRVTAQEQREAVQAVAQAEAPRVLIYHTHTYEAYQATETENYKPTEKWRTRDEKHNMIAVGDALSRALTARGFIVVHDTTAFEPPTLSTAYKRSLAMLRTRLDAGERYDYWLDVHRDAYSESYRGANSVETEGGSAARVMLLVGKGTGATGSGFDERPDWPKNLELAQAVTEAANALAPGICREVKIKSGRFNQHVSTGALLIEIGNNRNTLSEALAACPIIAEALERAYRARN